MFFGVKKTMLCHAIEEERKKFENIVKQSRFDLQDENVIQSSCHLDKFIVNYYYWERQKKDVI